MLGALTTAAWILSDDRPEGGEKQCQFHSKRQGRRLLKADEHQIVSRLIADEVSSVNLSGT